MNTNYISFNREQCTIANSIISGFPEVDYVQIYINREKKKLALHLCDYMTKDSLKWCSDSESRNPRHMRGRIFFLKLCSLMNWDRANRYKIFGEYEEIDGEAYFFFDLDNHDTYSRLINEKGRTISVRLDSEGNPVKSRPRMMKADCPNQLRFEFINGQLVYGYDKTESSDENPTYQTKEQIS